MPSNIIRIRVWVVFARCLGAYHEDEDETKNNWMLIKMENLFSLKEYNTVINTSVRICRQDKVPVC